MADDSENKREITNINDLVGPRADDRTYAEGEPAYTLLTHNRKLKFEPGELFVSDIYISGVGRINLSKIFVSIPPYLLSGNVVWKGIGYNYDKGKKGFTAKRMEPKTFDKPFIIFEPSNIFFYNEARPKDSPYTGGENYVEINGEPVPPFTIEFSIANNAPRGDHIIPITLYYRYKNKWYISKEIINMHINNWYQSDWVHWFALLTIFPILSAVINIFSIFDLEFRYYLAFIMISIIAISVYLTLKDLQQNS